jgi:hypothetical protein
VSDRRDFFNLSGVESAQVFYGATGHEDRARPLSKSEKRTTMVVLKPFQTTRTKTHLEGKDLP